MTDVKCGGEEQSISKTYLPRQPREIDVGDVQAQMPQLCELEQGARELAHARTAAQVHAHVQTAQAREWPQSLQGGTQQARPAARLQLQLLQALRATAQGLGARGFRVSLGSRSSPSSIA